MKTTLRSLGNLRLRSCGKVGIFSLLLCGGLALSAQAQTSLGGTTWDCLISGGGQNGIAILTFSSESAGTGGSFMLSGYELVASTPKSSTGSGGGRNDGGDPGRYTDTNAPSAQTNLFGFADVYGSWGYDSKSNVIGFLWFLVQDPSGSITTNAVSFQGKVVPNKRLTLMCSTSYGKVTYRGLPFVTLTNLSGSSWYGVKTQSKQLFQEFFGLSSGPMANIYQVNGQGPAYGYSDGSYCMVSRQNKIGFSFIELSSGDTNGVLRATIGNFDFFKNPKRTTSNTKGAIQPATPIQFKATLQQLPAPPPS